MTIREIIVEALKRFGADGVCNPEFSCGCGLDDLSPCESDSILMCEPAKRKIATAEDVAEESEYEVGDEIFVLMEAPAGEGVK